MAERKHFLCIRRTELSQVTTLVIFVRFNWGFLGTHIIWGLRCKSALDKVKTCLLPSAKPSATPMMQYSLLDPWEYHSVKLKLKYKIYLQYYTISCMIQCVNLRYRWFILQFQYNRHAVPISPIKLPIDSLRNLESKITMSWYHYLYIFLWWRHGVESFFFTGLWLGILPVTVGFPSQGATNRPISQIPQCIRQISHNAPFCNINVHTCAYFCYKMLHCGIWHRCILGFLRWVYSELWCFLLSNTKEWAVIWDATTLTWLHCNIDKTTGVSLYSEPYVTKL